MTGPPAFPLDLPEAVVEACGLLTHTILLAREGTLRNIMVVSPAPGEGATMVAVTLGLVVARDRAGEVLLVDANLRAPRLHEVFQLERERGLTDVLGGVFPAASAVKKTGSPNLCVMTAGGRTGRPLGRLELQALQGLCAEIRTQWPLVIWDSAPIGTHSEGMMLASLMDGIVLVLLWGSTPSQGAREAKKRLQDAGGHILGVVLNREPVSGRRWPS
jgi:capsular exopolysaccharide synthesis family protein